MTSGIFPVLACSSFGVNNKCSILLSVNQGSFLISGDLNSIMVADTAIIGQCLVTKWFFIR
ncbi:hypothetical protein D3C80_1769370 [compost metagenome]